MSEKQTEVLAVPRPSKHRLFQAWRGWLTGSVNRRLFSSTVILGVLTLLVKGGGAFRDMVFAKHFGTGDDMDAFVLASTINVGLLVILTSSINYCLVPVLIRVRENGGPARAQALLSNVMLLGMGALVTLAAILALNSGWILPLLAGGFSASKLHLTQIVFLIMLPGIVLSGVTSTGYSILQSEKRFILAGISPLIPPMLTATLLIAWIMGGGAAGAKQLAVFACVGYGCEFTVVITALIRRGYSLLPRWTGMDDATRAIISQCGWRIAAVALSGLIPLIEQGTAARLGEGSVSVLSYGNKLVGIMIGVGGVSLATVALPHFSHVLAANDWATMRLIINKWTKIIFALSLPAVVILVVFSEPMIRLVFERGSFTHASTLKVSHMQALYALQIPFNILNNFYSVLAISLNAARLTVWGNLMNLLISLTLNFYLSRWLGIGGIAISSFAVFFCSAVFLRIALQQKFNHVFRPGP